MVEPEKKPDENNSNPPAGDKGNPPAPNPSPSADELLKKNQELEKQIKERDTQIADLSTTKATIEARQKQMDEDRRKQTTNSDLTAKLKQINEKRAYDPEGADADMANLLSEVQEQASKDAVVRAQQTVTAQTTIEKLRMGVKSSNPDFDDDVVDVIMSRANELALSGKFKTADEAIKAAIDFVKSKFDSYAQKKNAVPSLPDGTFAETGANKPPEKAKETPIPTPEQEIEERKTIQQKKII